VASLRRAADSAAADRPAPPAPPAPQHRSGRWRAPVATVLIVLGVLLAPLSVVARWAHSEISDTDRYVATVAPLATDPAVQDAIANRITNEIFVRVDVRSLVTQAVDALIEQGVPANVADPLRALTTPLANGVQSFVRTTVDRIVHSQAFADSWTQANRFAHQQMVIALTGEGEGALTIANDTVSVNLAAFIDTVKQALVANGFELASKIPEVNASFVVFQSADLYKARRGFNLLGNLATWLPIVGLILIGLGVYLARSHRRALVGAGLGVAASMLLLGAGLAILRPVYLDSLPASVNKDAATAVFDALVHFMRLALRTVLVVALVVAVAAFLTGPSATAVTVRNGVSRTVDWLRGGAERAGLRTGPVGTWAYAHRTLLRAGVVGIVVLLFVFTDQPSAATVLTLTVVLLAALAVIEFLARPPRAPSAAPPARGA
jgi:hypothetical protein